MALYIVACNKHTKNNLNLYSNLHFVSYITPHKRWLPRVTKNMGKTYRNNRYKGTNPWPNPVPLTQPVPQAVKTTKTNKPSPTIDSEPECIVTKCKSTQCPCAKSVSHCTVCKEDIVDGPKAVTHHLKCKKHKQAAKKALLESLLLDPLLQEAKKCLIKGGVWKYTAYSVLYDACEGDEQKLNAYRKTLLDWQKSETKAGKYWTTLAAECDRNENPRANCHEYDSD